MGDSYRPGGGGRPNYNPPSPGVPGYDQGYRPSYGQGYSDDPSYGRSQDTYRSRDDGYRPQQFDHYPPPPPPSHPYRDSRPPPPPPPPSYYPQPPAPRNEPPRNPRGNGFTFRGAAGGQPSGSAPDFSFNAPSNSSHSMGAPQRDQWDNAAQRRRDGDSGRSRGGYRGRGQFPPRGRGRGGFGPPPAHTRNILNATGRASTPEQLHGMEDGHVRFKSVSDSSDSDNNHIDLTKDSDDEDTAVPRKRAKTSSATADSAPKWSNPDPYTALPPPETLGAPKKDIVQVIRKAKMDTGPKQEGDSAVKGNDDFISFDDMDTANDDTTQQAEAPHPAAPAPSSTFSHRENPHNQHGGGAAGKGIKPASRVSGAPMSANSASAGPPAPPLGVVLPTDEELAAMNIHPHRGAKRKYRDTHDLGDVVDEWIGHEGQNTTPWLVVDHSPTAKPGLRLHKEICDFFAFVSPREYEQRARQDLVARVQDAVRGVRGTDSKNAKVHCFGSFASGLYLPTADMDLVVLSDSYISGGPAVFGTSVNQINKLRDHFTKIGMTKNGPATSITRAKVPLVKFVDRLTGIKVDISFENQSGFPATETFHSWKKQYPAMPVLVALVKQLLAIRNLNEVFSGGIGGFTTICLVVNLLQTTPELQSMSMDSTVNLGEIFIKFLDFFGSKFDIVSTGILMHPPYFYDKTRIQIGQANSSRLTIIDPNNDNNDIAGGSRHIDAVFRCFGRAKSALERYMALIEQDKIPPSQSILGCLIGGNYQHLVEQREKLRRIFGGNDTLAAPSLPPAPAFPDWDPQQARPPTKPDKMAKWSKKHKAGRPFDNNKPQKPVHQAAQNWQARQNPASQGQSPLSSRTRSKEYVEPIGNAYGSGGISNPLAPALASAEPHPWKIPQPPPIHYSRPHHDFNPQTVYYNSYPYHNLQHIPYNYPNHHPYALPQFPSYTQQQYPPSLSAASMHPPPGSFRRDAPPPPPPPPPPEPMHVLSFPEDDIPPPPPTPPGGFPSPH